MIHSFNDDFRFSNTAAAYDLVIRACKAELPDCIGVKRASHAEDKAGVDFWAHMLDGSRIGIDLKLRRKDYGAQNGKPLDCVVELDCAGSHGWLNKAGGAELILFAASDTGRYFMVAANDLRVAVITGLPRWVAAGKVHELQTTSKWDKGQDGRQWKSKAVAIGSDLILRQIQALDSCAADYQTPL